MADGTTDVAKDVTTITLGCDPMVDVRITETATGTLFIVISPTDPTVKGLDIDGIFFDVADDSALSEIGFFPDANGGSVFSPVTGIQAAANAVDTLSNGAQVAQGYDVGVQFGTVDSSTSGEVPQANFTLFSNTGAPLSISDLDLDQFAVVVGSDGGNGQVLTPKDAPGDDPVFVDKEVLFEDFDDIYYPSQSDAVESADHWMAWDGRLFTNGCNDGTLTLAEVATDGPASISFDINAAGLHNFENGGHYGDSLRLEVQTDGGDWVLLDEFRVNADKTALVGSETGNSFGHDTTTLTYSVDGASETAQFRLVSDISANDEQIFIDNVSVSATMEMDPNGPVIEQSVVAAEDFNDIHDPAQSDIIASDDHWDVRNDKLFTNGCNDGVLQFDAVQSEGPAAICFDIKTHDLANFENSGYYADSLNLEVRLDNGDWQLLDQFQVNDDATAMVGSETGNTFGGQLTTLEYSGGILDDANGLVEFRFVSDISASNERILIDNVEIKASEEVDPSGPEAVKVDFEAGLASGDVVDDQIAGVSINATRAGDPDGQNDAMIFDSSAPTGGDHDLEFADQGNILIISEDNDSSDADDNAGGGTISFDFEAPSEVVSLNLLDIEEAGGTIDLFDADGTLISSVGIPVTGDGESQEVEINVENVSSMDVTLVGSGAIDDLCYVPSHSGDDCDAQYDVGYGTGLPMLPPVPEDADVTPVEDEDDDMV